jgi:hypothetical protein
LSVFQLVLVFLLIHQIRLLAIPIALALVAAIGLSAFYIRKYSFLVHDSDALFRDQWKWFWLPLAGSMALATSIALAARPQSITATVCAEALYAVLDSCFLLAVNEALRVEVRQLFAWMLATASFANAR